MIDEWAREWRINPNSPMIADLKRRMGIAPCDIGTPTVPAIACLPVASEARQQALIRLEAARLKVRLFRNNSGAFSDDTGRVVRYGLANESSAVNEVLKSPDLIGWRPRLVTADMVGNTIGQCTMREVKHEGWTFNPKDKREQAQFNFLKLAIADGCDAAFAAGPGTL